MKAILVVDMSDGCPECPLCENRNVYCLPVKRYVDDFENGKPSWCPLKPMPKAKRLDTKDLFVNTENRGWNDCLAQIMGETE